MDACADAWAKLWCIDEDYILPDLDDAHLDHIEPLTAEDLLRAAATFDVATGLWVDNFHPERC